MQQHGIAVLGIFAADASFCAERMPLMTETLIGSSFTLGPGGKGSNQAIAAARAGAEVTFISKIGKDTFGQLAVSTLSQAGVKTAFTHMHDYPTGAAFIYICERTGENAILVVPGAGGTLTKGDVENHRSKIEAASVFITQLEQPLEAAIHGLSIARMARVITIFNPAPAKTIPDSVYKLCDYIVPNEVEAAALVGFSIHSNEDAVRAADVLISKGANAAIITLGARGVLLRTQEHTEFVPAISAGTVIDTSGAGDAFLGGFASAISRGLAPIKAVRFGCVTAGIAVTRRGAAAAMPRLSEIEEML